MDGILSLNETCVLRLYFLFNICVLLILVKWNELVGCWLFFSNYCWCVCCYSILKRLKEHMKLCGKISYLVGG